MSFQGYLKYIAIFIALGALFIVTSLYLRHRLETKYRDLSIIFLLGMQYNQYERNQVYANNTSRMVTFLDSVRNAQKLDKTEINVNSRTLANGMILNLREKYYEVHFNNEFTAYTLSPINLVNPHIYIIEQESD